MYSSANHKYIGQNGYSHRMRYTMMFQNISLKNDKFDVYMLILKV